MVQRGVDGRLEGAGGPATVAAVGGDDDLGLRVGDAGVERLGGEPTEHHRVRDTDPGAGEHRDDGLGDHRQVDGDRVALAQAEVDQRVGGLLHLTVQVGIRDVAGVPGLSDPVQRDLVPAPLLDVAVHAVVCRVELTIGEPLRERRVRPVEHLGERLAPRDVTAGLIAPEPLVVGVSGGIQLRGAVRLSGEGGVWREAAVLVEQVCEGLVRHGISSCGRATCDLCNCQCRVEASELHAMGVRRAVCAASGCRGLSGV
ncbi:MAG: hypothetical protein BWY91_00422 [bacterium ADurb.BinA028]|nr:MAG: hypothetical protein BWY91_00422 [bacterium ADurb.BinA028]